MLVQHNIICKFNVQSHVQVTNVLQDYCAPSLKKLHVHLPRSVSTDVNHRSDDTLP